MQSTSSCSSSACRHFVLSSFINYPRRMGADCSSACSIECSVKRRRSSSYRWIISYCRSLPFRVFVLARVLNAKGTNTFLKRGDMRSKLRKSCITEPVLVFCPFLPWYHWTRKPSLIASELQDFDFELAGRLSLATRCAVTKDKENEGSHSREASDEKVQLIALLAETVGALDCSGVI